MARNKIGLNFDGWQDLMADLDELAGSTGVKRAVESAQKASKQYVNQQLNSAMSKGNLPAGGKYSNDERTRKSIDSELSVEWQGDTAEMAVGFNLKESGLTSIFLMYGTPSMDPVKGLKAAIYGAKTQKEVARLQEEAVYKVMQRIMGGG